MSNSQPQQSLSALDQPPAGGARGPSFDPDDGTTAATDSGKLDALAVSLAEERELVKEDHERIVAERSFVLAELSRAHEQLQQADTSLRELTRQRDEALQTASELETRVRALSAQLDNRRAVADNAARERDDYGMRLLDAEQRNAVVPRTAASADPDALRRQANELQRELDLMRTSVSWRVTRPLRSARTVLSRLRAR